MDASGVNEQADLHKRPLDRRKSASTTADGDQGDTCRICRGEGTIEQPLFYPCKCSGSIRFVHQDCLMEWLSHSQKKYCELCKTSFRFTKLYNPSMPANLPLPLFLRQIAVHALRSLGRWFRYVFVTFIWTSWLPWSIRQIWRGLFWLADGSWMGAKELKNMSATEVAISLASMNVTGRSGRSNTLADSHHDPTFNPVGELFHLLTGAPLLKGLLRLLTTKSAPTPAIPAGPNSTDTTSGQSFSFTRQPSLLSNVSSLNTFTNYPLVNDGLIDILEGQLICLSVIAAFILVFLIREWVINQQPILNMPIPDQAEAQLPVVAPPAPEARQPVRRRRRGFRRLPDREELPEDQNDLALELVPDPHLRRRLLTEEQGLPTDSLEDTNELHGVPRHSPGFASSPPDPDMIFRMDMGDPSSWVSEPSPVLQDLESPPLQRGIFDEVVDIRRNIEERAIQTRVANEAELSIQPDGQQPKSPLTPGQNNSSQVHPAPHFSPDMDDQRNDLSDVSNGIFAPTDNLVLGGSPAMDINSHYSRSSDADSSWESMNNPQEDEPVFRAAAETADLSPPSGAGAVEDATDIVVPDALFDRLAQWMWHTDEQTRLQDQTAARTDNEAAHPGPERVPLLPANNANPAVAARGPNNPQPNEANIQLGVNINDPNALDDAEDLEGILELIGMEGPVAGMIQNIIFSVFLITLTLSASVWCPYIWGKIAILVMSNPVGVFIKAPLFIASKLGNILIDLMLFIGGLVGFGLSNVAKLIKIAITPAMPGVAAYIKVAVIESWTYGISQNSGVRLEKALSGTIFGLRPDLPTFSMQSHHALRVFRAAAVKVVGGGLDDLSSTFKNAADLWQRYGLIGLPMFIFDEVISFPQAFLSTARSTRQWWLMLTEDLRMRPLSEHANDDFAQLEWTTDDKILAILVGYVFFALAGFAYLKIAHAFLGLRKNEKVDGVFADSLRQAGGVLKVIIIIGIEMIVFPLYCGLLLDSALLPLFKEATFQSRLQFLFSAPVTCLFIHWFVGTCYMFHFALFVSMCRKIMRKGVLYFIRDPDDPTFHPVRDVLERPVATQLGKIAFSALVYGGLVIVCLGGVVWSISGISKVLPIRWATSEPRLAFPVDIIFFNFMLPVILKRAEPSRKISIMYEWWFRQCAKALRLSHFLFGEERQDEKVRSRLFWQGSSSGSPNGATISSEGQAPDSKDFSDRSQHDGRYVRAPAMDSVRIPKGTRVFIEVDENNERVDGQPDRETGMHGKKDQRFTKIYIPPYFRARVSAFIFLVWLFSAAAGVTFTILPLVLGRQLIRLTTASKSSPNDLYAFTLGIHVCVLILLLGYAIFSRSSTFRTQTLNVVTNTKEALPRLYKTFKHTAGLMYLFTTIFVILPFAASLLTELYVHMPIYSYFASTFSPVPAARSSTTSTSPIGSINPTIFILQTWTLGLLYLRLAVRFATSYPGGQNRPSTALRAIIRNGYFHPDVALATRALIIPSVSLCIILLTTPLGLARIVITFTGTTSPYEKLQMYRYSYPCVLGLVLTVYAAIGIQHKIEGWRVKVRDEVYLVGERLHNFTESEKKMSRPAPPISSDKGKEKAAEVNASAGSSGVM